MVRAHQRGGAPDSVPVLDFLLDAPNDVRAVKGGHRGGVRAHRSPYRLAVPLDGEDGIGGGVDIQYVESGCGDRVCIPEGARLMRFKNVCEQ